MPKCEVVGVANRVPGPSEPWYHYQAWIDSLRKFDAAPSVIGLRAVDERHKNEATRMERQYEVRFAGVVAQFSERINSMERNMSDKMDFMIKMIQQGRS